MAEVIRINENIKDILLKHTQKQTPEESLNEILKNEINRKIKKYLLMVRHFERKYNTDFDRFEAMNKDTRMDYETEKDYFDWDMAVTALEDLHTELTQLQP